MTSPTTSGRRLSKFEKNGRKCRLRRLQVEYMENGLSDGHAILHTYRGHPVSQTSCRIWRHQLLSAGCKMQLSTAQKCAKRVGPAKWRIIRSRFGQDPWHWHTDFDWTSAEIVKLSGAAFCLAPPIGGLLVIITYILREVRGVFLLAFYINFWTIRMPFCVWWRHSRANWFNFGDGHHTLLAKRCK